MKTTLDLLNEVINLEFDQQKALGLIDASLDEKLGIEHRKPLSEEQLPDDIYARILGAFQEETNIKLVQTILIQKKERKMSKEKIAI